MGNPKFVVEAHICEYVRFMIEAQSLYSAQKHLRSFLELVIVDFLY